MAPPRAHAPACDGRPAAIIARPIGVASDPTTTGRTSHASRRPSPGARRPERPSSSARPPSISSPPQATTITGSCSRGNPVRATSRSASAPEATHAAHVIT